MIDSSLPLEAQIISCMQDAPSIFSWHLRLKNGSALRFSPGQFNMVYLYGVGEVPISISSDPNEMGFFKHTIRAVGRVTRAMQSLKKGDWVGIRGPYGRGWPMDKAKGKDVLVVTGGLGCAPTLSVIEYILARRKEFGALTILQGVKHSDDLIYREHYRFWETQPDVTVKIAADEAGPHWPYGKGYVTDMITPLKLAAKKTIVMMCGPEMMMKAAAKALINKKLSANQLFLSMERNMECGIKQCGHCQFGGKFICQDGPVFDYPALLPYLETPGF